MNELYTQLESSMRTAEKRERSHIALCFRSVVTGLIGHGFSSVGLGRTNKNGVSYGETRE